MQLEKMISQYNYQGALYSRFLRWKICLYPIFKVCLNVRAYPNIARARAWHMHSKKELIQKINWKHTNSLLWIVAYFRNLFRILLLTGDDQSIFCGFSGHDGCSPRALITYIQGVFAHYHQVVAALLIQTIQRAFFHPLRSAPGPWANCVSEIPATIALVTGNQHTYYRSLHDKYGPVVRVSPGELSFVSVEAREEIYGLRVG